MMLCRLYLQVPFLKSSLFLFCAVFFTQCITPHKAFDRMKPPPQPDYALEKNWAALPWKKDSADVVPSNSSLRDAQVDAKADVFFIHPTLYFKGKSWNADVDDQQTNNLVDKYTIREQASVFNGSCKVYAPRYRQATLAAFSNRNGDGFKALDTAYNDVRRAFAYYLKYYNKGRPIIIASHSQGTFMAERILAEFFDHDPKLYHQLVAAYLVGGSAAADMFTTITPCDSASETGCYTAWHTRRRDSYIAKLNPTRAKMPAYENVTKYECTNPLTWKRDTAYAAATLNLGSVPGSFDRVDVGMIDAQRSPQSIIWIKKPAMNGYRHSKNYHVMDYNIFYMNVRENVRVRVEKFLEKK